MRAMLGPAFRGGTPVEAQRRRVARIGRLTPTPRGIEVSETVCGGVPGEWVTVRGAPSESRAILYLHGGGYCVGAPSGSRVITGNLARRCAARVFAAAYRLAPEDPFPAAVEDAVAAYRGLLEEGFAPESITLAGDSAGGGLVLAAALRLRALAVPLPATLVAFSPWVDLGLDRLEPAPPGEFIVTRPWLEDCARRYLAGHRADDPLASPVEAQLGGLPPTLIQVGTDELLLPDARRLHAALVDAGVEAELREYPGRWHVFQLSAGALADANRALDEAAEFIRSR